MAKFELTIDPRYVPNWGVWEGVREMMQNALDGDSRGFPMKTFYKGGYLVIQNKDLRLDRQVLLLGNTTKYGDTSQRGNWGEGMKLGLLALLRAQIEVFIMNDNERWTPMISHSETFGTELLSISTRKQKKNEYDFSVFIGIAEEQWEDYKKRFLPLRDDVEEMGDSYERVLLNECFKGHVYANGIFVRKFNDLEYGYDFKWIELDRDRRMVDEWDLKNRIQRVWKRTVFRRANRGKGKQAKQAKQMASHAYHTLSTNEEGRDFKDLGSSLKYTLGDVKEMTVSAISECFKEEHGEEAKPVATQAEAEKLEHVGVRTVIVPRQLHEVLSYKYGSVDDIYKDAVEDSVKDFSKDDLEESERTCLTRAVKLLCQEAQWNFNEMFSKVKVSNFVVEGQLAFFKRYDDGSFEVKVSRKLLTSLIETLKALVHEFSHIDGIDGSVGHRDRIDEMWSSVVNLILVKTGVDWIDEI